MKLSLLVALSFCVSLASCTYYYPGYSGNGYGTYGNSLMYKRGYGTGFMGSGFGAIGGLFHMIIFVFMFTMIINMLFSTTKGIGGGSRYDGSGYGYDKGSKNDGSGYGRHKGSKNDGSDYNGYNHDDIDYGGRDY